MSYRQIFKNIQRNSFKTQNNHWEFKHNQSQKSNNKWAEIKSEVPNNIHTGIRICNNNPPFMDHWLLVAKGLAWLYEALSHATQGVGPPKTDGSYWRALTKRDPLEERVANHPSILAVRNSWTVVKQASGRNGIPVELFKTIKDDAIKVLHSICQQIWETQQWP